MFFILHFSLNNFHKAPKQENFLAEMYFHSLLSHRFVKIWQKKFFMLIKSSQKEKYFFHLWFIVPIPIMLKYPYHF